MSYLQKILQDIEEFRRDVHDGELDSGEIAAWLFYQRKLEPSIRDQVKLLRRDVSRAMSTQVVIDSKGRRVRQKLCLRRLGGLKGGKARANKLSPEERVRIAQVAASKRWSKSSNSSS